MKKNVGMCHIQEERMERKEIFQSMQKRKSKMKKHFGVQGNLGRSHLENHIRTKFYLCKIRIYQMISNVLIQSLVILFYDSFINLLNIYTVPDICLTCARSQAKDLLQGRKTSNQHLQYSVVNTTKRYAQDVIGYRIGTVNSFM